MSSTTTVMLCGVGGQGTILAADLIARVARAEGLDVKLSEIHGMAQRGGAVSTVVRFGPRVASMVCGEAEADCVVAFETTEALRLWPTLKPGGAMFVNEEEILPLPVAVGAMSMPAHARERLAEAGAHLIPASRIASELGSPKSTNIVLLGALASFLPFEAQVWRDAIEHRVPPKTVAANLAAFDAGLEHARAAREVRAACEESGRTPAETDTPTQEVR